MRNAILKQGHGLHLFMYSKPKRREQNINKIKFCSGLMANQYSIIHVSTYHLNFIFFNLHKVLIVINLLFRMKNQSKTYF